MTPVLRLRDVAAGYGGVPVVRGLSLEVGSGDVVALLGPNGAGKTTVVRTIIGLLPVIAGEVVFLGAEVHGQRPERIARMGVALVPEHRGVFKRLTARQNLRLAGAGRDDIDLAVQYFPALGALLERRAGLLSGGEQQMLSLARAIIRRPRLLLVDELSHGLAPVIVDQLLPMLRDLADQRGCAVLMVEQHVDLALEVADHAYVIAQGELVAAGPAAEIARSRSVLEGAYLAR